MIALPLLIMVVAMLYLSENHAVMRCGRYIREEIELHVNDTPGPRIFLAVRSTTSTDSPVRPRARSRKERQLHD